jgi:hypothetical protein
MEVMSQKRKLCFTGGHILPTIMSPVILFLVMSLLCWRVFTMCSIYTTLLKSAPCCIFRQMVIIIRKDIYFDWFLLMPQLCWTMFTVHSIYNIFFKSTFLSVFRQLVIEDIYIFIDFLLYHNGHRMFNIHNILEICFSWKYLGDWLSLYGQYILLDLFFNISGSDQNKIQTT